MECKIKSLYICVKNLDRAVAFWEDFFERPIDRWEQLGGMFDINGFRFMLFDYQVVGEKHIFGSNCLPSIEVESLKVLQEKLAEKEICFPLTQIGPNWVAEFVDSEGNHIEIFTPVTRKKANENNC